MGHMAVRYAVPEGNAYSMPTSSSSALMTQISHVSRARPIAARRNCGLALSFQHGFRPVQAQIVSVTDMRKEPGNRKRAVPDSHHVAGLKPTMAIGAAGLAAGAMLAGGISTAAAPESHAAADIAASQPLVPGVASARLTSADIATRRLPPTGPRAIVITDSTGDGPGPKAVIIPGGSPPT